MDERRHAFMKEIQSSTAPTFALMLPSAIINSLLCVEASDFVGELGIRAGGKIESCYRTKIKKLSGTRRRC